MSDFSQILIGVLLLGQGVLAGVTSTDHLREVAFVRSRYLKFKGLTLSGALNKSTLDLETSAYIGLNDLVIAFDLLGNDDL
jgi:hypothetical protein